MDMIPLLIADALTLGVALLLALLAALAFRKTPPSSMLLPAISSLLLTIAFGTGYIYFFHAPPLVPTEAWQMVLPDALVLALLLPPVIALPFRFRPPLLLLLVIGITLLTVREKVTPRPLFFGGLAMTLVAYVVTFRPSVRNPALPLLGPALLFPPITGACMITLPFIDTNLGRMLMLISVLTGFAIVVSLLRPLRSLSRGMSPFLAMLFAPALTLAAFYNDPFPSIVFPLLAVAPLPGVLGYLPYFRHRQWKTLFLALPLTLAITAVAVAIALKHAPAIE